MQRDRVLICFQEIVNFFGIYFFEISKKPEKHFSLQFLTGTFDMCFSLVGTVYYNIK